MSWYLHWMLMKKLFCWRKLKIDFTFFYIYWTLIKRKFFLFFLFSPCISLFKVYFLLVLVREHSNIHFLFSLLYFSFRSLVSVPRFSTHMLYMCTIVECPYLSFFVALFLTSISRMSLSNVAISLRFLVWTWMSFLV